MKLHCAICIILSEDGYVLLDRRCVGDTFQVLESIRVIERSMIITDVRGKVEFYNLLSALAREDI